MKPGPLLKVDYDNNFILIAVITILKDYQFAYCLNKYRPFLFSRLEKDISSIVNKKKVYFSAFKHVNAELDRSVFLVQNKSIYSLENPANSSLFKHNVISNTSFLISELKEFDYLIKFTGIWKNEELLSFLNFVKNLSKVESQANINLAKIKSINNLVF